MSIHKGWKEISNVTLEQLRDMITRAVNTDGHLSGMTYEQGVRAALDWAFGNTDDEPIDAQEEQ